VHVARVVRVSLTRPLGVLPADVLLPLHPAFVFGIRGPARATLFPYTTLFRSRAQIGGVEDRPDVEDRHLHGPVDQLAQALDRARDRKSTRLNSSHDQISYAVCCLKKKRRFDSWSLRTSLLRPSE